jgi:hypothetical protein
MLLTQSSHFLFFGYGNDNIPNKIREFSVKNKVIMAKFDHRAFKGGISRMALSPDSNKLYVATKNELRQVSIKDGKVIQLRNFNERPDMKCAYIHAMRVTRNNQYLVTGTTYFSMPEKGTKEDL